MASQKLLTPDQFAESIKTKYPQYKDTDNATLTAAMIKKYPQYKSKIDMSQMNSKGAIADTIDNIGKDFKNRGKNAIDIAKTNADEIQKGTEEGGLKGLGNILKGFFGAGIQQTGNVAGAVGDMFSEVFSTIIKKNPAIGDVISKGVSEFMDAKNPLGETNGETIKKLQDFSNKHPEAAKDLNSAFNISALLVGEGGAKEGEGAAEGAVKTAEEGAADATKIEPKEPGIRAQLTPVKEDVKTSFKSLVDGFKGDTKKAKAWITDLFSQEKGRVGNVDVESPNARLANADLTEAKSTINKNIATNIEAKNSTIEKFGDTPVTGFTDAEEGGKQYTTKDVMDNFTSSSNKLLGSTVRLTSSQANVLSSFKNELAHLVQKGDLKAFDEFVDTWQNTDLGKSGTNSEKLNAVMASTVHDLNESAKSAADSVDGGAYRNANKSLNQLYQVRSKLETGLGDKGAFTGKYGGAANFYKKAAEGDSAAKAALEDIEKATGIPIAQRANIAKFVEAYGKKTTLSTVLKDVPGLFITRMGRLRLYNDLVSYLGDPEGAAIQELDKYSKGKFSSTIDKASGEIEGDSEMMGYLKKAGMTSAQGAALLMLGAVNGSNKKDSQ